MNLILLNPFTFINSSEQEAIDCGATPYIKKQESATFLESSPCYKKGQKPGAYSLDCLQQTFISAGCTTDGNAYPRDGTTAASLMSDPNTGKMLTASEIAGNVYSASTTAYTGINPDGTKMSIKNWNTVSRYCTGRSITSPCDFDELLIIFLEMLVLRIPQKMVLRVCIIRINAIVQLVDLLPQLIIMALQDKLQLMLQINLRVLMPLNSIIIVSIWPRMTILRRTVIAKKPLICVMGLIFESSKHKKLMR
jgi:hypothetical protein